MTPPTELRDWIGGAQGGDRRAFERAIAAVEADLRRAIDRHLGRSLRVAVDPEDILQETLLRAFESIGRFSWDGERSFQRWLQGIAENLILAAADKRRRRAVLEVRRPSQSPSQASPSRALRREERWERLEKSLALLSPDHREVIRLSRIEGLEVREIAERMGRTPSAVKNLLLRALKELKRSFGDTESLHLPAGRSIEAEKGDRDGT